MEQIRDAYPNYTEDQLSKLKEHEFVNWLKFYVSFFLLIRLSLLLLNFGSGALLNKFDYYTGKISLV